MKYIVLTGRIFFSLIFIIAGPNHFSSASIGYAASQGVPLSSIVVPLSGLMALIGGLSIATGFKAKWGALLIIIFLIPVTLMMHQFWTVKDPMMMQMQMEMFMKNIAMLGGAMVIANFGSGPLSIESLLNSSTK